MGVYPVHLFVEDVLIDSGSAPSLWRCLIEVGSIATGIKIISHNLLTSLFRNKSMSREINLHFWTI
jgi:hypothetical protein